MNFTKKFFVGLIGAFLVLLAVAVVMFVAGAAAFGLEILAQHQGVYGDPDVYGYDSGNEGIVFGISFVIILALILSAFAYAMWGEEE